MNIPASTAIIPIIISNRIHIIMLGATTGMIMDTMIIGIRTITRIGGHIITNTGIIMAINNSILWLKYDWEKSKKIYTPILES